MPATARLPSQSILCHAFVPIIPMHPGMRPLRPHHEVVLELHLDIGGRRHVGVDLYHAGLGLLAWVSIHAIHLAASICRHAIKSQCNRWEEASGSRPSAHKRSGPPIDEKKGPQKQFNMEPKNGIGHFSLHSIFLGLYSKKMEYSKKQTFWKILAGFWRL